MAAHFNVVCFMSEPEVLHCCLCLLPIALLSVVPNVLPCPGACIALCFGQHILPCFVSCAACILHIVPCIVTLSPDRCVSSVSIFSWLQL